MGELSCDVRVRMEPASYIPFQGARGVRVDIGLLKTGCCMRPRRRACSLFTPVGFGDLDCATAPADLMVLSIPWRCAVQVIRPWVGSAKVQSADLILTQPKFDPKTIWLIIDSLDAIKWTSVWAGHALGTVVQRFTAPFVNTVLQRPHELDAIKSLHEAAAWENLHHHARR